jgi:hypothetical protein
MSCWLATDLKLLLSDQVPDSDPANNSGSVRIRIHNTGTSEPDSNRRQDPNQDKNMPQNMKEKYNSFQPYLPIGTFYTCQYLIYLCKLKKIIEHNIDRYEMYPPLRQ